MLAERLYDGNPNSISKLSITAQAGGTGATGGAFDTSGHRDAFIAQVQAIADKVDALIDRLRALNINV